MYECPHLWIKCRHRMLPAEPSIHACLLEGGRILSRPDYQPAIFALSQLEFFRCGFPRAFFICCLNSPEVLAFRTNANDLPPLHFFLTDHTPHTGVKI